MSTPTATDRAIMATAMMMPDTRVPATAASAAKTTGMAHGLTARAARTTTETSTVSVIVALLGLALPPTAETLFVAFRLLRPSVKLPIPLIMMLLI
jgi:hypothetical protein